MHSRNPYRTPPDFASLAEAYPSLRDWLVTKPNGGCTIDFRNETAQRHLTKALLYRDFGLTLTLPSDRLCPPIPNRLNYLLWIQDIVRVIHDRDASVVRGIDVGTGASAIYPLLACRMQPDWIFAATEIDETSIRCARQNVELNNLGDRITILAATQDGPILSPFLQPPDVIFDFMMCNPPFYSSAEEIATLTEAKESVPNAICTGADVEMITPGGESAFVCRIVHESLEHKSRCRWYTSMMGKMSSLFDVVALLRQHKVHNYAITEFVQGQTRRWGIAWSFTDIHLPDDIARASSRALHDIMAPRNTLQRQFSRTSSPQKLTDVLAVTLASVTDISFQQNDQQTSDPSFAVWAMGDTWSRAARRRNKKGVEVALASCPAMRCSITVVNSAPKNENSSSTPLLEFQWIEGEDRPLYESFCNHISRKVDDGLEQASLGGTV